MNKYTLAFFAALSLSGSRASAQPIIWTPHLVTTDPLTKGVYPRLPPDEVEAAGPDAFAERLQTLQQENGSQRQDLAIIRVEVRGVWFLSVETVAKEKAASLGANFLILEASQGAEDNPGAFRVYRAVRLQRFDGLAVYTRSREAVEGARGRRTSAPAPAPAFAPLKKPSPPSAGSNEELGWLWFNEGFIVSHRLGVDLAGIADSSWKDLENTVRLRFPKIEHEKLTACRRNGATIVLDIKQKTLSPSC